MCQNKSDSKVLADGNLKNLGTFVKKALKMTNSLRSILDLGKVLAFLSHLEFCVLDQTIRIKDI